MQHDQEPSDTAVSYFLSLIWWPLLYFGALTGAWFAFASTAPIPWFNFVYAALLLTIVLLERMTPHRAEWLEHDGETLNDLGHTLLTKGAAQLLKQPAGRGRGGSPAANHQIAERAARFRNHPLLPGSV